MIDDLTILLPTVQRATSAWRWGTVTQASPLRVRLDGDAAALNLTPDRLVTGLTVGHRVWCQIVDHRVIVHGRAM